MASGRLGISSLPADTNTVVYTVPASTFSVISFNMVNTSTTTDAYVSVAIGQSDTPAAGEYVEFKSRLNPSGVIERTGIAMSTGERVIFNSDLAGVNVRIFGIEEAI